MKMNKKIKDILKSVLIVFSITTCSVIIVALLNIPILFYAAFTIFVIVFIGTLIIVVYGEISGKS